MKREEVGLEKPGDWEVEGGGPYGATFTSVCERGECACMAEE